MSEQVKYPPAGPARDRLIAEKLGWTVHRYKGAETGAPFYALLTPDGYPYIFSILINSPRTAKYGTDFAIQNGQRATEEEAWRDAPQRSTDSNASLPLLKDIPEGYVLWDAEKEVYRAGGFVDGPGLTPEGESADPAGAITMAWLVWQDGK